MALFKSAGCATCPCTSSLGFGVWLAMLESGVHATIAGVALGLLAPARPFVREVDADRIAGELSADQDVTAAEVREHLLPAPRVRPGDRAPREPPPPVDELPHRPALRAGQRRGGGVRGLARATPPPRRSRSAWSWGWWWASWSASPGPSRLVVRFGGGRLPAGITPRHVLGMAGIAGIGFTVSLFVAGLAFERPELADQAKIGVLAASVLAALVGAAILRGGESETADLARSMNGV